MGPNPARRRIALDTNVLLDLADGEAFAHDFRERCQEAGFVLLATQTALVELNHLASHGVTPKKRRLAAQALGSLVAWGIDLVVLQAVGNGIALEFFQALVSKGYLPAAEENDATILAEAALAGVPLLATSDRHLLDIPPDRLKAEMEARDLMPVHVASPCAVVRALFGR